MKNKKKFSLKVFENFGKFENYIFKFVEKKSFIIVILILTIISAIIRIRFMDFVSDDYNSFLAGWIEQIKESNGIYSLKENIGNYNIPYITILTLITYIPTNTISLIKIISMFFDFICAFAVMNIIGELFKNNKNRKLYSLLGYVIVIILPTVILNSSAWGQCDSIYSAFALFAILYLIKGKYTKAFIFLGVSFAFKLQAIFVIPVFLIIYISKRKFSILNFLTIPIVNIILSLPALIIGKSFIDILKVYLNQAQDFSQYSSMNFPGIYSILFKGENGSNLIATVSEGLIQMGIFMTLGILVIMAFIILQKKEKVDQKMIINLSLWSVLIMTFFLPRMHDRYLYLADIISILYLAVNIKRWYVPVIINFISLYVYIEYLYASRTINIQYVAILNLVILCIVTKDILEKLLIKEEKIKKGGYTE